MANRTALAIALACLASGAAIAACGSDASRSTGPVAPREESTSTAPAPETAGYRCPPVADSPAVISREDLRELLDAGIPALLAEVQVEPVLEGEDPGRRFVGFRIVAMAERLRCGALGLHEGDVVAGVNGMGVERPEDLQLIWENLYTATAANVSLIRGGLPVEVSVSIEDPPVSITNEGVVEEGGSP